jgi:hypothetical protein
MGMGRANMEKVVIEVKVVIGVMVVVGVKDAKGKHRVGKMGKKSWKN